MNISRKNLPLGILTGLFLSLAVGNAYATNLNIADSPVFLSNSAQPNIMIMLDNSGSMKRRMYTSSFSASTTYSGLFDPTKTYKYDPNVPVNNTAYGSISTSIDTSKTGAFYDTSCTPGPAANCWNGNFLNFLTTRRIDASREALVGGKLESRTPFDYRTGILTNSAYTTSYKIIANNEPSDSGWNNNGINTSFNNAYSNSATYSPIPDNNQPAVTAPANSGNTAAAYDPYAKLTYTDSSSTVQDLNLAVIVTAEPTGLIQDVKDIVRLGISFYRYDTAASDMYIDNYIDGGTMRFNIPKNPFISNHPIPNTAFRSLEGYIGTNADDIIDTIEHYPLVWGTTPLAENLLEVIRYFQQGSPQYPVAGIDDAFVTGNNTVRDPYFVPGYGKLTCTKSSILVVTDGSPYNDANVPTPFRSYDSDTDSSSFSNGRSDYLDDVARWAHCSTPTGTCDVTAGTGLRDLRATTGDIAGDQYLNIHTVAFANGTIPQILQDTATNGGGFSTSATDGTTLRNALTNAIKTTIASNTSASAVATNSTRLNAGSKVYQATFTPSDWSGTLAAYSIGTNGTVSGTASWTTDTTLPANGSRNIYSYNTSGIDFTWANLSATQKASLWYGTETTDANAQKRVTYIRGNDADEKKNSGPFRDRTKTLGDIVNSSPWFAGNVSFGYETLPEGLSTATSPYSTFLTGNSSRNEVLYVGANDGMMHAFNASTGAELFAYIPSSVIPNLNELTDPNYGTSPAHRYFVDGSVKAGDVYFTGDADWHTALIGSTGAGGRNIFALDVTAPGTFGTSKVLWDITNNTAGYGDLGFTMTEPSIVRMANGAWAAIVANGYNSTDDRAVIYIINIEDGSLIRKFDTGTGTSETPSTPNGMSTPIAVDVNGDHIVDTIYAGDLRGNMWKIDVDDGTASNWKFAYQDSSSNPAPLFKSVDYLSTAQPITAKPVVGAHPLGGVMVYFGTGKYFENSDNVVIASTQRQSFYAIRDDSNTTASSSATSITGSAYVNSRSSDLTQQTITSQFNFTTLGSTNIANDLRFVSSNTVNYSTKKGWYIDLIDPGKAAPNTVGSDGERVISAPLIRGNRIVFVTLEPETDPCSFGGSSWFMELDAISGATLGVQPFDLNDDGVIDADDLVYLVDTDTDGDIDQDDNGAKTGGRRLPGISGTPSVVLDGDKEHKLFGTSNANVKKITESRDIKAGRQSWRQLK